MVDRSTQPGFRFSKVMVWAPAVIAVIGFTVVVLGYRMTGGLLILAGLIFWLIVRRRKEPAAPEAKPAQPRTQPPEEKAPPTT